jgi:cation:H+ antiporter
MLEIGVWIFVFLVSLVILIKASDYFTESAEKIGVAVGIPTFIVGVTIVALGTSLPELASSIIAVLNGASEIVVGNVVGSNIANIFFVLGFAAIMAGNIKVYYELIRVDLPILIGASLLFAAMIWDGLFTWQDAILSLLALAVYLAYVMTMQKERKDIKSRKVVAKGVKKEVREKIDRELRKRKIEWKTILVLVASLVFIYIGAKYTIDSVLQISEFFNIGTEIIAIVAIALGTSLPELFVTISAVKHKNTEIAVGNILGSTIFNSLAVMGIPALIGTIIVPQSILSFGLPMMLIAVFLFFFITLDKEITRYDGWLLLIFYVFFVGKILGWI